MTKKVAVILFNLGGPDSPEAVKPFLFNLFNDKAIIGAPQPIRWLIATLISTRRAPVAKEIYEHLGGKSPLLELTKKQAEKLQDQLNNVAPVLGEGINTEVEGLLGEPLPSHEEKEKDDFPTDRDEAVYKVFPCMRYWHPMADQVVTEVKNWQADEILLLPLYPQFSTTTTGSSLEDWKQASAKHHLRVPTSAIGCYPFQPEFIEAHVTLLRDAYRKAAKKGKPRILFSAHGLPKKIVEGGDPYQWQIEQTAKAIAQRFAEKMDITDINEISNRVNERGQQAEPALSETLDSTRGNSPSRDKQNERGQTNTLDYVVCYQSKVGPLEWLKPSTDDEILRACEEGVPIVLVPVAFVSEHSETLVELDIEYREMAEEKGCMAYERVPALGSNPHYIDALETLCRNAVDGKITSDEQKRLCPAEFGKCVCQ